MTTPTPDLARLVAPVKRIDAYLSEVLNSELHGYPPALQDAMRYAVLQGGKRLRPLLTWYSCEAFGVTGEAALPACAAVEFVHAFSLVHDDLPALDNDDLRRGKPTLHKHAGEAMAILAGDALLNFAYRHLSCRFESCEGLVFSLSDATGRMIAGQVRDTLGGFDPKLSLREKVELVHSEKTGALIYAACYMGYVCALMELVRNAKSKPPKLPIDFHKSLAPFAWNIGLIFQIVDDLIDLEQSADHAGKRTGKDASAGKLTFPAVFGAQGSRDEVARLKAKALERLEVLGPPAQPLRDLCEYLSTRTQ
jgi:geranylgeranyl diphosphate synthase type II